VAKLDDERVVGEARENGGEVDDGLWRFVERKRELQEDGAEFVCFAKDIESGADIAFVFFRGRRIMGEFLPELRREDERGIGGDAFEPKGGVVWTQGLIEGSVDFDGVEKFGEICGFVEIFGTARGIDVAGPVAV
jgi:hypothetical protein